MRHPLPSDLPAAFTVRQARQRGITRSRLDGPDLERPFHGVRARQAAEAPARTAYPDDTRAEIQRLAIAYGTRMRPTEFFSHTTATVLWGLPLPRLDTVHLQVSVLKPHRAPRSTGLSGHQVDPRLVNVTTLSGLRVATPASTWASLGASLLPYDLVAVGDAVVCARRSAGGIPDLNSPPLATLEQLRTAMEAGRRPGVGALRDAFGRIRTGAWSRPETWVRLILVDAGLPEPSLNVDVYDESGLFLGCVDLAYPDLRIAIEYEGEHHFADARQFQRDIDRLDRFTEHGWRIVRLTKRHVYLDAAEVVRRVSVARIQRGADR